MYKVYSPEFSKDPFLKMALAKLRPCCTRLLGAIGLVTAVGSGGDSLPSNALDRIEAISSDTSSIPGELGAIRRLPLPLSEQDFIDGDIDNDALFELGRHLFFDPVLSGNQNIS